VVGGVPLLRHHVAILASVGITDVVVVVGYGQEIVRASLGGRVTYVVNESFGETNSMVSFLLAAQGSHEDVVVMNGDVFFHPVFLSWLVAAPGDALLYDSTSGDEDEHMKVRVRAGHLVKMSKVLPVEDVCGENVGILRLTRRTVEDLVLEARAIVAAGGKRAWFSAAVNRVARTTGSSAWTSLRGRGSRSTFPKTWPEPGPRCCPRSPPRSRNCPRSTPCR